MEIFNSSLNNKPKIHSPSGSEPKRITIHSVNSGTAPNSHAETEVPQASSSGISIHGVTKHPEDLAFLAIQGILKKENISELDLEKIEKIFKKRTGINLHIGSSYDLGEFLPFFVSLLNRGDYKDLPPEINHIIIGHGVNSAKRGDWRFLGNSRNVYDFVERKVPRGEKVMLVTCESAYSPRPGIGTSVQTSLTNPDEPAKIVKSGIRDLIGTFDLTKPGVIQYF